ncbi:MAG TPA: alpha/beta hydrolase [Kiloniellaceae bacterium]|nr:alpha/beta hydrolase [Kiloniellaceae bacterium]
MTATDAYRPGRVLCLSPAGFHRMAYRHWGAGNRRGVVICVHGLTRNGSDFDLLAEALASAGWQVYCPDVVGRGASDWLASAESYGYPQYLADMAVLIGRCSADRLHWVGTSMGGLMGMMLAADPKTPLASLLLNDIGPLVPNAALRHIGTYVGKAPSFPDLAAAEAYLRETYCAFGPLSDALWRRVTKASVQADGSGYGLNYDPQIAAAFRDIGDEDIDLWALWDRIALPTMTLRGALSELLLPDSAAEMTRRGPKSELQEVAGCGHAPWLMTADQIGLILDWLDRQDHGG